MRRQLRAEGETSAGGSGGDGAAGVSLVGLQHRRLVERGCTLAQGYRLGQPRPLDALG